MPSIKFYANVKPQSGDVSDTSNLIDHAAGSGIGFYGNGFRVSVPVGSQQNQTYVTNDVGTAQGVQLNNTAVSTLGDAETEGTVAINGGTPINLSSLPNMSCPLNIRFEHETTAVRVQNCKLRIFNRQNIDEHAVDVVTSVYEARHPNNNQTISQLGHRAYPDDNKWFEFDPSNAMEDMELTPSPGDGGTNSLSEAESSFGATAYDGASHQSQTHDWYLALSSEPVTIGSKTEYGLYVTMEYLE